MNIKDLREKTDKELSDILKTSSQKLSELRFNMSHTRSKNVKEMRELRRDRARVLTLLRERAL